MKQSLAIKNNQFSVKDCRKFSNSRHSLLLCSEIIEELEIFLYLSFICAASAKCEFNEKDAEMMFN